MIRWFTKRADPTCAPLPQTGSERFERKFYLPESMIPFASHLLAHCCPEDRQYPRGTIHSVYYDTPDLEYFNDSQEGNYGRVKVRVRWYDFPQTGSAPVFLELANFNLKRNTWVWPRTPRPGSDSPNTSGVDYSTIAPPCQPPNPTPA